MASLKAIRVAAKATIETHIPDLTGYPTVPEAVQVPAFVVEPAPPADFLVAMGRGVDTWNFDVHILVASSDAGLGQDELDDYITGAGAKSIRQVIFNNRTLGLTDTDAHIAQLIAYGGQFESAGIAHIGATLRLVVHTPGTE